MTCPSKLSFMFRSVALSGSASTAWMFRASECDALDRTMGVSSMSRTKCMSVLLGGVTLASMTALATVTPAYASSKHHAIRPSVSITAQPAKVNADGLSKSQITVKVLLGKKPDAYASVKISASEDAKGSCGRLAHLQGRTDRKGIFQESYRSSLGVGFCTISAAVGKGKGSISIDQKNPFAKVKYLITLAAKSTSLSADGSATTTLTATVTNHGTAVSADPVLISSASLKAGSCGVVALGSSSTNSSGQLTAVYTTSDVKGSCQLSATEAISGSSSGALTITQG